MRPAANSTETSTATARPRRSRRRKFTSGPSTKDRSTAIAIGISTSRARNRPATMIANTTREEASGPLGVSAAATRVGRGGTMKPSEGEIRFIAGRASLSRHASSEARRSAAGIGLAQGPRGLGATVGARSGREPSRACARRHLNSRNREQAGFDPRNVAVTGHTPHDETKERRLKPARSSPARTARAIARASGLSP